ncbi:MAG TPA: capsule biosynthesis protein CapK, partial [Pseudomonas sp.]|nr:capsule biosynthesis protein CapK [Pseudomonas sp.]
MTANAAELAPWLDTRRLPELSPRAAQRLQACLQHPDAPTLSGRSGHHLDAAALSQLQIDKQLLQYPDSQWLTRFLDHCRRQVPRYRGYPWHLGFDALPCTSRQDLSSDVAAFVPTDIDPQRLIVFETSGTTGHPLRVPSLPLVAARYHCFHERIVGWHGIDLQTLPGDTGVMLVGDQQRCFTYASVLPYWDDKVLLKLNMNPADWPSAAARGRYLDRVKPLLMTGDPRSLSTLLTVDFEHQPAAILSTSMTLLDGLKARLRERFACPVINLYSMNEAGPIAACDGSGNGLRLVQSTLKVE